MQGCLIKGRGKTYSIYKTIIAGIKFLTLLHPVSLNPNSEYESELACKVEFYILEVHLSHLQNITAIRQEDIPPLTVFRHILILTLSNRIQFFKLSLSSSKPYKGSRFPHCICSHYIHFPGAYWITSNCNCPTVPTIFRLFELGSTNNCATPSRSSTVSQHCKLFQ